jgi:hypothetical protein
MLRRLQDVHGITLNPMLVTVFVATSDHTKKDIPPNITEIFKKFTEEMLGRWDAKKGLAQQYQATLKDFLLCHVAFAMHSARRRVVSLDECRALISEALTRKGYEADLDVLFDEAIHRSNLLRVEDNRVEFTHHILQEFFAGRGAPNAAFFEGVVADEWWRKPIVFFFGEHSQDEAGQRLLMDAAERMTPLDRYDAAITIGLAVQACFLADMVHKENSLEWVVRSLATACDAVVESYRSKAGDFDLYMFIAYYLGGRDAVASDYIRGVAERIATSSDDTNDEFALFWCIVGLLEAGHMKNAEQLIAEFHPQDRRLLLALHLGAFFKANLRISTDEDKKSANRICRMIGPKVSHLIQETVKQWDSYLLELRDGEISEAQESEQPTNKPALGFEESPGTAAHDSGDPGASGVQVNQ